MNLRLTNLVNRKGEKIDNRLIQNIDEMIIDFRRNVVRTVSRGSSGEQLFGEFEISTTFDEGTPSFELTNDLRVKPVKDIKEGNRTLDDTRIHAPVVVEG